MLPSAPTQHGYKRKNKMSNVQCNNQETWQREWRQGDQGWRLMRFGGNRGARGLQCFTGDRERVLVCGPGGLRHRPIAIFRGREKGHAEKGQSRRNIKRGEVLKRALAGKTRLTSEVYNKGVVWRRKSKESRRIAS